MGEEVRRFFDEFARAASGQDAEDLAGFYDDGVVHVTPSGARPFANDGRHRRWLGALLAQQQRRGLRELTVLEAGSYDLGPAFLLATVRWQARHARGGPAEWVTTYVLRRAPDGLRIASAVQHEDKDEALRRAGAIRPSRSSSQARQRTPGETAQ